MKRKLNYLAGKYTLLAATALFAFSCTEGGEDPNDSHIILNNDSEILSKRLSLDGTGVIGITSISEAGARITEENAQKISLVMISQASSPEYNGRTLQATHVDIDGQYAFVSYNTAGADYLGAVEILDISDVYKPKILSQAIFTNADVSSLEYRDGQLFLAMAMDVDNSDASEPANLGVVAVANGNFASDFKFISVPGYVATDVATTSTLTAVVSGSNGALTVFDRNLNRVGR